MDMVITGLCLMCFVILLGTYCLASIRMKRIYKYDDYLDVAL